jgi:hypothetical protein
MGFEKPRIFRFFKKSKNVKVQNVRRFFRLFILSCTNCNFSVCDFMSLQQFYNFIFLKSAAMMWLIFDGLENDEVARWPVTVMSMPCHASLWNSNFEHQTWKNLKIPQMDVQPFGWTTDRLDFCCTKLTLGTLTQTLAKDRISTPTPLHFCESKTPYCSYLTCQTITGHLTLFHLCQSVH